MTSGPVRSMLKEYQISDLINQSGRLRMLSHRAAMLLAQIGAGIDDPWFYEEMAISVNKFENGYAHVREIIDSEPLAVAHFEQLVNTQVDGKPTIKETISSFLQDIKRYQSDALNKRLGSPQELSNFLKFVASDLLVALNSIVSFFEKELNEISTDKLKNISHLAKNIEDAIDEVDQINLSIKILSFNASVEAARAGDVGRGFAVVSKEMNSLSSNTRLVTQKVKDTVDTFVEQLNN